MMRAKDREALLISEKENALKKHDPYQKREKNFNCKNALSFSSFSKSKRHIFVVSKTINHLNII